MQSPGLRSRNNVARPVGPGGLIILRGHNTGGSLRQKQPRARQHFLNSLPEPQGHRSLRPNFSSSNLFPWTMRAPRFTRVSEGKPRRRLLIGSKTRLGRRRAHIACHTSTALERAKHGY